MGKNTQTKIMLLATTVFLLIVVSAATFAYFGSFTTTLTGNVAVNINAASPGNATLVTTAAALNLQVPAKNMSELNKGTKAGTASGSLNVNLTGTSGTTTTCTYDIVFEYTTSSNIYGLSPTTVTDSTKNEITLLVATPTGAGGTNNYSTERSFAYDSSTWTAKTSSAGAKRTIVTGATIKSTGTSTVQKWTFTSNYYNLDVAQTQLAGKNFAGKFYVTNNSCSAT